MQWSAEKCRASLWDASFYVIGTSLATEPRGICRFEAELRHGRLRKSKGNLGSGMSKGLFKKLADEEYSNKL